MTFENVVLSPQKEIVRAFYKDMWDHANVDLIPLIFHEDFTFRGSLGPVLVGHNQFADYVTWVTGSLQNYTTDILLMVEEGSLVTAKVRFHGIQREPMFGLPATNLYVAWLGAPVFKFEAGKVRDLWVLGDIHGLLGQIRGNDVAPSEFVTSS
ncbi:ester cyclase [Tardiphaga robiniae]|uniref:Ester cyclase n=2 Tax=Tardiphaga robiniae TaxID=943830 RepID=A0A161SKL0_9BRAD|nr:ester cyclase [Tardiphaga robiniae]